MAQTDITADGSFPARTRIICPQGPVDVEHLRPGQMVLTPQGPAPLRLAEVARINPAAVMIQAGAFGEGVPQRNLVLAVDQLICLRDQASQGCALAPVGTLVNGSTVTRIGDAAPYTWHALGLDRHEVILVEHLAAATQRVPGAGLAFPAVPPGPALFGLRGRIARGELKLEFPDPDLAATYAAGGPDLMLIADGHAILSESRHAWVFIIPPQATQLRLVSPVRHLADSPDVRRLGVAVTAITLDGVPLRLGGSIAGEGFYHLEGPGTPHWRWTNGDARLDLPPAPRPRRLVVDITDWHRALTRLA